MYTMYTRLSCRFSGNRLTRIDNLETNFRIQEVI